MLVTLVRLRVRESAKRVLELCKDKEKIKKERQEAKKLRTKIVGVGNTMDSYGDKFQSGKSDQYEETRSGSRNRQKNSNESEPADPKQGGSYDPYVSTKPLSERIGVILDDVDKIDEGDNSETIRQKLSYKNGKQLANQQTSQ